MPAPTSKTPGVRYLKVFICHGCQTCWDYDAVTDTVTKSDQPHYLGIDDVTDEMVALGATLDVTPPKA